MTEKKRVAFVSVLAALFLTGFKLVVGIVTGSLGLLSEALHSGLDLIAAVITLFSVRISDRPPDRKHHYGHGKVENLSALVQTLLLLITCSWIIYEAISRLTTGKTEIEVNLWSYVVVITSIVVDVGRSRALYRVARKHNSQALEADALHFSTDIWSSSVVLLGLACANFGFFAADPVAALVVALIVLYVSYRLGRRSINVLLDSAPHDKTLLVEQIIRAFPEILRFHDLKVRTAGPRTFIRINIHLDPGLSLKTVHSICDSIEKEIKDKIAQSEISLHPEPDLLHN